MPKQLIIDNQVMEEEKARFDEMCQDALAISISLGWEVRDNLERDMQREYECYLCHDLGVFLIPQETYYEVKCGKGYERHRKIDFIHYKCGCPGTDSDKFKHLPNLKISFEEDEYATLVGNMWCAKCTKKVVSPTGFPVIDEYYFKKHYAQGGKIYNALLCQDCAAWGVYFEPLLEYAEQVWKRKYPDEICKRFSVDEWTGMFRKKDRPFEPDDTLEEGEQYQERQASLTPKPLIDLSSFRDKIIQRKQGDTDG